MNRPVFLPYANRGFSDGEILRREYLKNYLKVVHPVDPNYDFVSLNDRLDINKGVALVSSDPKVPVVTKRAENTQILFAVGNGAESKNPSYENNTTSIEAFDEFTDFANIPDNAEYVYSGDITSILPLRYFPGTEKNGDEYAVYKPILHENTWYRKFFTKKATILKEVVSRRDGQPVVVTQISCHLDKEDLAHTVEEFATNPVTSFNELTLYFGTKVSISPNSKSLPSNVSVNEPTSDFIEVVPFYHVLFSDVGVANLAEDGLTFVIEIVTKEFGNIRKPGGDTVEGYPR